MLIDHGSLAFDGTLNDLMATAPAESTIEDVVTRLYTRTVPS
jgi:ABC-2 type transport system ATP-binding protein